MYELDVSLLLICSILERAENDRRTDVYFTTQSKAQCDSLLGSITNQNQRLISKIQNLKENQSLSLPISFNPTKVPFQNSYRMTVYLISYSLNSTNKCH